MLYSTVIFIKPLAFSQPAFTNVTKSRSRMGGISVLQLEEGRAGIGCCLRVGSRYGDSPESSVKYKMFVMENSITYTYVVTTERLQHYIPWKHGLSQYVTVNTKYGDHHNRYYHLDHHYHYVACRVLAPVTCSSHINTLEVF
jgi:hypothetical protein